jgi:hypothetical protein
MGCVGAFAKLVLAWQMGGSICKAGFSLANMSPGKINVKFDKYTESNAKPFKPSFSRLLQILRMQSPNAKHLEML